MGRAGGYTPGSVGLAEVSRHRFQSGLEDVEGRSANPESSRPVSNNLGMTQQPGVNGPSYFRVDILT